MANNPADGSADDFLEQILGFPNYAGTGPDLAGNDGGLAGPTGAPMMLQLNSGDCSGHLVGIGLGSGGGGFHGAMFPLGLSLDQGKAGFVKVDDASGSGKRFRDDFIDCRASSSSSSMKNTFQGQSIPTSVASVPHPPAIRPRVRARRGQATDPHSIAERLRRERIAERIRALQELVPSVNKTDRAAMLDEIVDYVKFLRLQVKYATFILCCKSIRTVPNQWKDLIREQPKRPILAISEMIWFIFTVKDIFTFRLVLSMSRLGGAGAVAPLVTEIPMSSIKEEGSEGGRNQPAWDKWSNDGTERQVAKLMEENIGAAMQLLQSKALCIMPVSLASAIYHTQPPDPTAYVKPETNTPP